MLKLLLKVLAVRKQCNNSLLYGSNGLQLVSLCQKFVEFVVTRLDTRKMVRCLWRVICVDSRFVVLVTTMKEVKGTSAVLSATLAISVKRVSLSCSNLVSFLYKHHVFNENGDWKSVV